MRKLNYKFSTPDPRDFKYTTMLSLAKLPAAVDLRPKMPPIYDQGEEGSCTAHAGCAHKEFLDMKSKPRIAMSRQFLYYSERVMNGDPGEDGGANMRDICTVLKNTGVCTEFLWPYGSDDMYSAPPKKCYTDAKTRKIATYYALKSPQFKQCLANGFPFLFGINVPEIMMSAKVAKSGILPLLKPSDNVVGGHALLCVGYDTKKDIYIIRNSWGEGWGQKGYFTIPTKVMHDETWVSDCFTIRLNNQTGF